MKEPEWQKVALKVAQSKISGVGWAQWYTPVFPDTQETEAEDYKFKVSVSNSGKPSH